MKKQANKTPLPPEEWDFRRCPESERGACLQYEYVREYVRARPEMAIKLTNGLRPSPYDQPLKFIFSDKWHPDSLPMFCPDFPVIPWLGLPPATRAALIAQCQLLPENDPANFNLLVEDEYDVAHLRELDTLREKLFAKWMQDNRDQQDREFSGLSLGVHVVEQPIERPILCNGPKHYYAVEAHAALAVIKLDWHKSDRELIDAFRRLLKRRPKETTLRGTKPSRGGRGGASDQLKKLSAQRLRAHYGSPEAAVEAIELAYSNTRNKPPYTDVDGLDDAATEAKSVLQHLERTGRFRAFADL